MSIMSPDMFGRPGSVRVARLLGLPEAMQREGLLLMIEMGTPVDKLVRFAAARGLDAEALLFGKPPAPVLHSAQVALQWVGSDAV